MIEWQLHINKSRGFGGSPICAIGYASLFRESYDTSVLSIQSCDRSMFLRHGASKHVQTSVSSRYVACLRAWRTNYREGTGIVHLHSGLSYASSSIRILRAVLSNRTPLVLTLHGPSDTYEPTYPNWEVRHRRNAAYADMITVPSEYEKEYQMLSGIPTNRVVVVPAIAQRFRGDGTRFRASMGIARDAHILLHCGRLHRGKGTYDLIEAFKRIAPHHPAAVLVLVGDGPARHDCERQVQAMKGRMFSTGWKSPDELGDVYAAADSCILPSYAESFGMCAIEAAMSGVPVVLSSITPWTSMFQAHKHCLFAPPGDVELIARMMKDTIADPQSARERASRAEKHVSELYGEHVVRSALEECYARAVYARHAAAKSSRSDSGKHNA